jgi:hypothetical protein
MKLKDLTELVEASKQEKKDKKTGRKRIDKNEQKKRQQTQKIGLILNMIKHSTKMPSFRRTP